MLNGLFLLNSAAAVATDPYFPYVTLLLPGNGSNGAQNNTFLDSSTNNFTITRNGNTTQGSFSPYGSYWSNYFDGSGDYLTAPDNAALQLDSSNFTIEFWVNFSVVPGASQGATLVSKFNTSNTGYEVILYNNTMYFQAQSANIGLTYAFTPTASTWYHIAWTRSGANSYGFINGALVASTSAASGSITNLAQALQIGRRGDNTFYLTGYMSNVRVVKGTAVYTSAFTPPTAPLTAISGTSLLTCQSNRFIDNSSNAFAITVNGNTSVSRFSPFSPASAYSTTANGGSAYFDGSGDYLSVNAQTAMSFGTGDFTIEAWMYPTSVPSIYAALIEARNTASFPTAIPYCCGLRPSGGVLKPDIYTGTIYTGSTTIPLNTWTHIAFTRSSSTLRIFVNGVLDTSWTSVTTSVDAAAVAQWIGKLTDGSGTEFPGHIANLRVVKGTAVYTANFTPPTAPVTAISGTSLLLNATNAAIYDNAMINDLETVGNAQVSTAQSKFGGSSMYFDGTGDYLTAPNSPQFFIGTGNFTIECWFYIAGNSSLNGSNLRVATLLSCLTQSGTLNGYDLSINGNGTTTGTGIFFENYVSGTNYQISYTGTVSQNTWHHVAVVRSGTTTTIYFNGTSVASGTLGNQTISNYSNATVIGRLGYAGYVSEFNGYIDDLRVTNGIARYTSNFTPPTAAFPVQ